MVRTSENETLTLQLTSEELALLRGIAKQSGTTAGVMVSNWVKERLNDEQKHKKDARK